MTVPTTWSLHGHKIKGQYFVAPDNGSLFHEVGCWLGLNEVDILSMQYNTTVSEDDGIISSVAIYWDDSE